LGSKGKDANTLVDCTFFSGNSQTGINAWFNGEESCNIR
jgi:hypothetical protein